jgi:hypothetical protein
MPSELNRRTLFAAAAAFLVALAVAYALSSTGQASEGSGTPGSPAEQLDVASEIAGQSTLGEAAELPQLVVKPKPKPREEEEEPADEVGTPVDSTPTQTYTPPPTTYTPPPTQSTEPPVEFSDSG